MKPTDNMITDYPPEVVSRFMATMRAQAPRPQAPQPQAEPTPTPSKRVVAPQTKIVFGRVVQELTSDRLEAIAAFYEDGNSYKVTAARFNVSVRTAMRAAKEYGNGSRPPARAEKLTDEAARVVYGRYLSGELLHGMAAETGIAYTTYRTRFDRLGLPFPVKR